MHMYIISFRSAVCTRILERRKDTMKHRVARAVSVVLTVFAALFVSTASTFLLHRPETPAEMLKK